MLKSLEIVNKYIKEINKIIDFAYNQINRNKQDTLLFDLQMAQINYYKPIIKELEIIKQDLEILEIIINDILMVAVGNNKIKYIDLKSIINTKKMFKVIHYIESNKVGDTND